MKKTIVLALQLLSGVVFGSISTHLSFDGCTGERVSDGTEELTFSTLWDGTADATVTITQNGTSIFSALAGEGVKTWSVEHNGRYELKHTTYVNGVAGKVETAVFNVEGFPSEEEPPEIDDDDDYYDELFCKEVVGGRTFYYDIINGGTVIRGVSPATGSLAIPSKLGGLAVTSIGSGAFSDCSELTSVTIPSSVTSIEPCAFYGCSSLTSISIPSSVTSIKEDAFEGCYGLGDGVVIVDGCVLTVNGTCPSSVVLPQGTRLIAEYAFSYYVEDDEWYDRHSDLKSITIPEGMTSVGDYAFACCDNLTSVTIPSSVTSIGYGAFSGCSSLTSLTIPEGVTSIGVYAFTGCDNLTSVTIPSSVTRIGGGAFEGCYGLGDGVVIVDDCVLTVNGTCPSSVVLPQGTRLIAEYAFSYYPADEDYDEEWDEEWDAPHSNLKAITIPESMTSIGDYAFADCDNLTSVTIPTSVTNIGHGAFSGCSSLTSLALPKGMTSVGDSAFAYCSLTSVTIPEGVTSIGDSAFAYCNLTSVTIPSSVKTIGYCLSSDDSFLPWSSGAFRGCSSLASVTIREGVTIIGDYTFSGCSSLTSMVIPEGVTIIGDYAFEDCENLKSVSISSSVANIGWGAFEGCNRLASFVVDDANRHYSSLNGILYNKDRTKLIRCPKAKTGAVSIPTGVTCIEDRAFENCSGLTSISIPSSVRRIGRHAFDGCGGIHGDGVVIVDGCVLTVNGTCPSSVVLPEGTRLIADDAFYGCEDLKSLKIPTSVKYIGFQAFDDCPGLGDGMVIVDGCLLTVHGWWRNRNCPSSVVVPAGVRLIADGVFCELNAIETLTIPSGVTHLGYVLCAQCDSLRSVTIPEGVTDIGESAFEDCIGLVSASIPSSVTHIDELAFANCGSLASLVLQNAATSIAEDSFMGVGRVTDPCELTLPLGWSGNSFAAGIPWYGGYFKLSLDSEKNLAKQAIDAALGKDPSDDARALAEAAKAAIDKAATVADVQKRRDAGVTEINEQLDIEDQWNVCQMEMLWPDDGAFSTKTTNVYDGWLADDEGGLVGFVRIKTVKQTSTATVTAPNGKKWSYTGGKARADGTVTGLKCTTKGCPVKTFSVTLGRNALFGTWDVYEIVGARNGTAVAGDAMKAAFPSYSGMWCTEILIDGETLELQLAIGSGGAVKATGTWSDGKKLSASTQLVMGDGFAYIPLKVKASLSSRAFAEFIRIGEDGIVAVVGRTSRVVRDTYKVNRPVFDVWQESDNAMVGVAFSGRATLTHESYPAKLSAATALPSGLKIATSGIVSGVPTKAGSFKPKLKAVSSANKNWITYSVQPIVIVSLPEWARGQFAGTITPADGNSIAVTATVGSTGKISGKFKTGATNWTFAASSFTTNSVTRGLTNLVCSVTAKGTYKVKSGKKTVTKTVTAPLGFTLSAKPYVSSLASAAHDGFFGSDGLSLTRVAAVKLAVGEVKGGTVKTSTSLGQGMPGTTVKSVATPKKGYAFLGWFAPDGIAPVSQATSYSRKMTENDVFLTALFKKESELAVPVLDWGAATDLTIGVTYTATPKVSGEAAVKVVSVTGLPKGLKYKSGKVSGVTTVAKAYTVSVKVALSTNAKKTWTLKQRLVVGKLPAWTTGTFVGGWSVGTTNQTTFTISSAGKVSGKLNFANAVWTLSASSLSSLDDDAGTIKVTATKGKTKKTLIVALGHDELGGFASSETVGYAFEARQNLWAKDVMWRMWAMALEGSSYMNVAEGLVVKFGENGVATAKLMSGANTFTGSAALCPTVLEEENVEGVFYFYFAPNAKKKFKGAIRVVPFSWRNLSE